MKFKITLGLLIVSLLFNVAGLIYFVNYNSLRGHYKTVSRQRDEMIRNVRTARVLSANSSDPLDRVTRREFFSHLDGKQDTFALVAPAVTGQANDLKLIVYLHGMGGTYTEPFVYPAEHPIQEGIALKYPQSIFLSCNARHQASWGSDAALADITQNIREVCQQYPVAGIVIMGTSMGGCVALTYAVNAPEDIKNKIIGVVSAEGAGDLQELYETCTLPELKPTMAAALGGTPQQRPDVYKQKSALSNLDSFPHARVAVLSARGDAIVPPQLQKSIVTAFEQKHVPVKLIEVDGPHQPLPAKAYVEALDFVMEKGGA